MIKQKIIRKNKDIKIIECYDTEAKDVIGWKMYDNKEKFLSWIGNAMFHPCDEYVKKIFKERKKRKNI